MLQCILLLQAACNYITEVKYEYGQKRVVGRSAISPSVYYNITAIHKFAWKKIHKQIIGWTIFANSKPTYKKTLYLYAITYQYLNHVSIDNRLTKLIQLIFCIPQREYFKSSGKLLSDVLNLTTLFKKL